jgi:hypothetical protein
VFILEYSLIPPRKCPLRQKSEKREVKKGGDVKGKGRKGKEKERMGRKGLKIDIVGGGGGDKHGIQIKI